METNDVVGLLFGFALFFIYFLPGIIAHNRGHQNAVAITTLNIILGWTVLGWIISLIWALTNSASTCPPRPQ
jgi:hypothetical protein